MRLVVVSHVHPAVPHVSAMRAWYFAKALAASGHQVIEICEARREEDKTVAVNSLSAILETHNWESPLLLPVAPRSRTALRLVRNGSTPTIIRKGLVAWNYYRHSGMFTDFSDAAQPYLPILAERFRPEATWGVFGNTDCWLIAQRLANLSGCPWVGDMKDPWETFVHPALRRLIAGRFRDMAAASVNAEFNARSFRRWFVPSPVIAYSGVHSCFFETDKAPIDPGVLRLTLTGSIRSRDSLREFVEGLASWLRKAELGDAVEVVYAGCDADIVLSAFARLKGLSRVAVRDYLPLPEFARLCRSAAANVYISSPTTFHHKLMELLSCGRAVISYPGETDESRSLSAATTGLLEPCRTTEELHAALDRVRHSGGSPGPERESFAGFSWDSQARTLERTFAALQHDGSVGADGLSRKPCALP